MLKKPLVGSLVLTLLLSAGLCLAQAPRTTWFPYMSDYYRDLRRIQGQSQLHREIDRLREKQMSIELKQQIRSLRDRQMTRYPKLQIDRAKQLEPQPLQPLAPPARESRSDAEKVKKEEDRVKKGEAVE